MIAINQLYIFQESLQKEAFSALQCAKDAKHMRLTGQIELIQQELAQLTMLEVEQRELRVETQQVGWTQWGRDKMAAIVQTTFSNAFSWMKVYKFWLRFH